MNYFLLKFNVSVKRKTVTGLIITPTTKHTCHTMILQRSSASACATARGQSPDGTVPEHNLNKEPTSGHCRVMSQALCDFRCFLRLSPTPPARNLRSPTGWIVCLFVFMWLILMARKLLVCPALPFYRPCPAELLGRALSVYVAY